MISPPLLRPGDKVGITSTAWKVEQKRLDKALETLKDWGLQPVFGANLWQEHHQFAGSDAQRAADLQAMIDDPTIKAILCARGGYGTLRMVDLVDLKGLKKHPKWLIGFSDVTTLLMAAYNKGIETIHGPMGISFFASTGDADSVRYLRQTLMEAPPAYTYTPLHSELGRTGKASGRLIGGNLSLLSQLMGTPTDFDTKGCILFIEDLDEYLYHIDRMVVHLRRGGKFDGLAGLIVGGLSDMKDSKTPFGKSAEEIIAEAVQDHDYPVCYDFPAGHQEKNYPLIHGRKATLKVSHTRVELSFAP